MKQSKLFYKTLKEVPKDAETISHQLLMRAGFIEKVASGVYNLLPLGYRVHKKIENIIRQEINKIGGQEVLLASLHPKEIWQKTDRWDKMDPPLFKLKDRHQKEFALGSTHEEIITQLVKNKISSYRDLPLYLYQIQTKFRNEMRSTGGLLRTREFLMADLYSFHQNEKDLMSFMEKVSRVFFKIFKRCGLKVIKSEASGGAFTQLKTYEFQLPTEVGEDKIIFCPKCDFAANLEIRDFQNKNYCPKCKRILEKTNAIELGHIFSLGTKYSQAFDLYFSTKEGVKKLVVMGCYGIGVGRLMAAIVEIHHDKNGIIWPREVAPFQIHLIPIENTKRVKKMAEKIYQDLQNKKFEVLYEDRWEKTAGEKFADCDLIGIPKRLVISEKTIAKDLIEIKERGDKKIKLIKIKNLYSAIN